MEPVTSLLFILGMVWACREGGHTVARHLSTARTKARSNATARGGAHNTDTARRRAARQATTGWWASEIGHGLPVTRAGFRAGWTDHRTAMTTRQAERAKADADHEEHKRATGAEIAAHQHRLAVARQARENGPTMSEQLAATKPPPLADGTTPGAADDPPQDTTSEPAPQPAAGHPNGTRSKTMDMNYEQAVADSDQLCSIADNGVHDAMLNKATTLADGLGGMVPEDSETQGKAADVVAAVQKILDGHKELQDAAPALKERLTRTYGPVQEAKDSSGERLPEKDFMEH
jgi:hypothetical protein